MPKVFTEDYGVEEALADYLNIDPSDVSYTDEDWYGLPVFETVNGERYLVTDDYDEVENACYEEVESLLDDGGISNFNVSIDEVVDIDWFEDAMRETYEINFGKNDLNDAVNKNGLVDVQKLTDICMRLDGAGSLLASYDGNEHEFTYEGHTFYAYRID